MQVLKFGGSSVASADAMLQVIQIVRKALETDRTIVVSSAISGCTDELIAIGRLAGVRDKSYEERLQALQEELGEAWYRSRVGGSCELLMERPSPRQDQDAPPSWQGRDPWGAPVHVALPEGRDWAGAYVEADITGAKKHSLLGRARGV